MANNDQDADRQDRLNQDVRDGRSGAPTRESRGDSSSDSTRPRNPGAERQGETSDEEDMDEAEDDRDDDSRSEGGMNRRRSIS
jgi:hypothetical protein